MQVLKLIKNYIDNNLKTHKIQTILMFVSELLAWIFAFNGNLMLCIIFFTITNVIEYYYDRSNFKFLYNKDKENVIKVEELEKRIVELENRLSKN